MTTSFLVWDDKNDPPNSKDEVLCWQGFTQKDKIFSIPRYVEEHAKPLRSKYLAFIYDLGESEINGKRVVDHLDMGDGFSFWWMTQLVEKSPFKSPKIYDCLRLMALEEILLDKKPLKLIFHSFDKDLAAAIKRLCKNLQIHFAWQRAQQARQKWSLRKLYSSFPHSVQSLVSLARFIFLKRPLHKLQKHQWFSGENAIFLCSYFIHLDPASCAGGRFYSRQWGILTKYLHDSGKLCNWIHHFLFSSVVPSTQKGIAWLNLFNRQPNKQGYHSFIETYLSWKVIFRALRSLCWLNIVSWRLRKIQSVIWLWPIIRHDWLTSLRGRVAINNCLWKELFDVALKDVPHQATGFYLYENQGWERALLHAWRRHGHGAIIGVQHATVPFWHLYYFDDPRNFNSQQNCAMPLPDRLAVNGEGARRVFLEGGYPPKKLVEVEALRYLNLSRITSKVLADSADVNVLILGDMLPKAMHSLLQLLETAVQFLPQNYQFTLKSHPGYAINLANYPQLKVHETSEALDKILDQYNIAIAANSTSASVDAYLAGLRVIIGMDSGNLNLSPLRGHPDVRFVSSPEELADALQKPNKEETEKNEVRDNFFFLDPELPRWQQILSS